MQNSPDSDHLPAPSRPEGEPTPQQSPQPARDRPPAGELSKRDRQLLTRLHQLAKDLAQNEAVRLEIVVTRGQYIVLTEQPKLSRAVLG